MANPLWQVLTILIFAIFNGFLAMSEIAVVSARKARLRQAADGGDDRAERALELASDPTQFLAAVQIGITLVGILAGAFGEATLSRTISLYLSRVPALAPYAAVISGAIVVLFVTYISLVIGELAPKRLALNNAERIASLVSGPMQALTSLTRPIVWLLSVSTKGVLRLVGAKPSNVPDITPEEIEILVDQGTELGIFEETEQDMIESVLRLDDRPVEAFMTPRTQITWLDLEDSDEELRQKLINARHSRFPVMEGDPDHVLGILYTKDVVVRQLQGDAFDLEASLRPLLFVPESMSTLRVLEMFKAEGTHLALVTDEYGGVEGMVTDMDILEAIVGAIPSIDEPDEPDAIQRDDGSWLIDGMLRVEELWEILDIADEIEATPYGFQTVSGFVMSELDGIPVSGQHFTWQDLRFEVVDMDGRRVDKVLVSPDEETEQVAGSEEGDDAPDNAATSDE